MKKFFLTLALLLCLGGVAHGQVTVNYGVVIGPAHTAQLNWSASVTAGVTSYNVYRSTVSGSGYVKIATVTVPTMTFTDQGLPAGNTYYYVITAVAPSGESDFSNQGTAVVPTP